MKNWKETTLGNVADVQTGPFGSQLHEADYVQLGTPMITVEHLLDDRISHALDIPKVSDEDKLRLSKYVLQRGDIVFSRVGSVDRSAYVSDLEDGWMFSGRLLRVRPDKLKVDPYFLHFCLTQRKTKEYVRRVAVGATMPSINTRLLRDVPLSIPPLEEQKEISGVLGSLDDKIELLREENKILEATAQTLFKEWFVNFNFPNAEGKPYKSAGGKMIDSGLGLIPEGWRVGKIKDLINILSGFAFSSTDFTQDGEYKLVTIKNVQDRQFDQNTKDAIKEIPQKMPQYCHLKTGDILLSLTGNVGRACLVIGEKYLLNQRVAKLEAIDKKDYAFSYLLFLQDDIFSLLQNISSGTAQQNLSPVQTKEIEIVIPSKDVLDAFGDIVNPMVEKINQNNSHIQTLSIFRDTLLPKLMNGAL